MALGIGTCVAMYARASAWRDAGSQRLQQNEAMGNSSAFDKSRTNVGAPSGGRSFTFGTVAEGQAVPNGTHRSRMPGQPKGRQGPSFLDDATKQGPAVTPRSKKDQSGFDYDGPWIPASRTRNADIATFWDDSEVKGYAAQRAANTVARANKTTVKKGSIDFAAADRSNLVFTAGVCATEMNETGRLIEKHWGVPDRPSTSAAERRVHVQVPGMSVRGTGAPVQNKGSGPKEYTESRLEARKNKRLGLSSSIPIGIGRPQSSPRRPIHAW